jgi:hypothetical protein
MSEHLSENLFEQDTQTPVLLPEQTDPLVPDDAFTRYEESLDDRPDATDLIVAPEEPPPLGRGWAYDFVNHGSSSRAQGSTAPWRLTAPARSPSGSRSVCARRAANCRSTATASGSTRPPTSSA